MSSQRRIDSSRANGAQSRGPVSPAGRARSRAACLTHGLRPDQLLLEGEPEEQFNALREKYLAEYQPQTRFRSHLVDRLLSAHWRHNRVLGLLTALMDRQIACQEPEIRNKVCDAETPAATAGHHLCDDSRAVETLNRYETRLSAELRRTLKLLGAPVENQKLHDEPNDAQPPHSEEDSSSLEAPRFPSAIDHPPSATSNRPAPEAPRFPSAIDHPPSTTKHARRENQKLHKEPNDAQPPHSDEDRPAAEALLFPSAIDHPPSTSSHSSTHEALLLPSTIDHPPSTTSNSSWPRSPALPIGHRPSTIDHQEPQLENQELHDEPSDTQPTHSDKDGDAAEDPPSTIDHPPSTPPSPENEPPKLPLTVSRSMK